MSKSKWFERVPVPIEIIKEAIVNLGTHATTMRLVETLRGWGYRSEEDVVSVLTHARRVGILILDNDWWRIAE